MKAFKYDWSAVSNFCKETIPTRREISIKFNIPLNTIHSAIRLKHIDSEFVRVAPKITEESKIHTSIAMKKAHKEGRHPGWSFINKDINRRSYPEKVFYKSITMNEYFNKYQIIEKLPFGKYFLDFALIEKRIDIEIDGAQHVLTEQAISHDIERDLFLNKNDWSVYRISWKNLQQDTKAEIDKLIYFIENLKQQTNRTYNIEEIKQFNSLKDLCICGNTKCKHAKVCVVCDKKRRKKFFITYNELYEYIQNYPIKRISEILNISQVIICKRAKEYNIQMFPRGYWTKRFYQKPL